MRRRKVTADHRVKSTVSSPSKSFRASIFIPYLYGRRAGRNLPSAEYDVGLTGIPNFFHDILDHGMSYLRVNPQENLPFRIF